jgi:hypothetical protein
MNAQTTNNDEPRAQRSETSQRGASAPAWIATTFFSGLVVLFLGQRVVLAWESVATAASWLGVAIAVGATLFRLTPKFRGSGEHSRTANLFFGLQVLGLLGVGLYFATTSSVLDGMSLEKEGREVVASVLGVAWTTLIAVASLALLFAEIALQPMRHAALLETRRVRAAALSGGVIGVALSYGSLFVYSAAQTEAQADFSYFKTSEPGEATMKLLEKMTDPLQVVAFFPEVSEVRKEVKGYVSALQKKAPNLEVKFVDRYLQPKLAKDHKVVADGSLVITRGETSETLRIGDELDKKTRDKLRTLDQDFNALLLKLLRTKRVAYATIGHGELNDKDMGARRDEGRSSEIFFDDLERQNYRVKDLGLSQGLASGIPDDAGIVMILGPIHPFAREEIESVRKYVERGGKVLLALDTDAVTDADHAPTEPGAPGSAASAPTLGTKPASTAAPKAIPSAMPTATAKPASPATSSSAPSSPPGAEAAPPPNDPNDWRVALAKAVGVEFVPTAVADESKFLPVRPNASAHAVIYTNRFSSHASVSTLSRHSNEAVVVLNGASHVRPLTGSDAKAEVTLRSFASTFEDGNHNFVRDDKELAESFSLAIALSRPMGEVKPPKDEPKEDAPDDGHGHAKDEKKDDTLPNEMRAIVIADADAFSDLVMFRFRTNRFLAADAVRWLGGEESLAGEFESEEDVRVEQTKQADMTWFYSSIFGVPLFVLGLGLLTSNRLRKGGSK